MSSQPHKLYNQEIQPPLSAWEGIAAALDESIISQRKADLLAAQEVDPPAGAWDRIATSLETDATQYASRLYQLEVAPPTAAWAAIAATLNDTPEQTPVVPIARRAGLPPFLRYAAAAVVIGLVAMTLIWLVPSRNAAEVDMAAQAPSSPTTPSISGDQPAGQTAAAIRRNGLAATAGEIVEVPVVKQKVRTSPKSAPIVHPDQSNALYAYEDHVPDVSNRYIMLLTPEGNLIRMSKKLSNLVCCVSGEEQDEDCKSQIRKWQEQLATSPITPSAANFMDVLNMVSTLNEDNGL